MAVARLVRVTLEAPQAELGVLVAKVIRFTEFHPSRKEGMVQDIGLLLLASRAQAVSAEASDLLKQVGFATTGLKKTEIEKFEAHDVGELVSALEDYLDTIKSNLSLFKEEKDRWGVTEVLLAIQQAAVMIFTDLQRILVYPPREGKVRFEGFVPTRSIKALRAQVGQYIASLEPVKTQGKEAPYIPTLLVNPRIISVFESLTLQRGLPKYGEVDPTPFLAFVFPFFFGIMFGDVGHGIALLAFGLYLIYRTTYKVWGRLILILSSSATVFGFIRGSFFGVTFTSPLKHAIPLPPTLSAGLTLSYIPFLIEVSILIGTFHLSSAYAISFVNHERAGDYLDAFLNRLPTALLYVFLVPFGFAVAGTSLNFSVLFTSSAPTPVFNDLLGLYIPIGTTARITLPVIVATVFFLIAGHPIREFLSTHSFKEAARGLGAGLVEAVAKPFEFFMNTLSYVRLGVLLITTTLLGSLVAGVLSYGVVGLLLAVFLNLAVITLEGIIVYIQDMRLQLYEWFSQFYAGTGTPFVPLVSRGDHFTISWA